MPLVYDELKRLAAHYLRAEGGPRTLSSTALVHEAYLKLVGADEVDWQNRAHFFGIAARMIRQILIDRARYHQRQKRGSGALTIALDESVAAPEKEIDLLRLESALDSLSALDERQSRIVELRFFTGLSVEETAEVLQISPRTVKRDWMVARAWLFREMNTAQ